MLGRPRAVAVAADAAHHAIDEAAVSEDASAAPNRSWSITATGRAPIAMISRTMPPTPVAAPGRLDIRGWLCDSSPEGHRPAVADVDHAGVLADTGEHGGLHLVGGGLTELAQMHLRTDL